MESNIHSFDSKKGDPKLREYVQYLITKMGDDPQREGMIRTPQRVEKAFYHLTSGYEQSVDEAINGALFEVPEASGNEMVIVRSIELYSLCEHHMLPFFGHCHIGYLPRTQIIGLSKMARIVDIFSKRFQVQERLTSQIAHCLMEKLNPIGVGVVVEANHLCMMMRGVEKQNAMTRTSCLLGGFRNAATRSEFFELIRQ